MAILKETVSFGGWMSCIRLSNGVIELLATSEVGPRVIRLGFEGGQNLFKVFEHEAGQIGGDEWRTYGGHRLWHAPEAMPRTYWPDNGPVEVSWQGDTLVLTQPVEGTTGIQKQLLIALGPAENEVSVVHRLTNRNLWAVTLAPWALSVMAPGGFAVLPQEPYKPHAEVLVPARPLVLWPYTNMADARFTWGQKYVQVRQDPQARSEQKFGAANSHGWLAYCLNGEVFIKRYGWSPEALYPDFGCNSEIFTNAQMLEVESLGPLTTLAPGESVLHEERWFLFEAEIGQDEKAIEAGLLPLVAKTNRA